MRKVRRFSPVSESMTAMLLVPPSSWVTTPILLALPGSGTESQVYLADALEEDFLDD